MHPNLSWTSVDEPYYYMVDTGAEGYGIDDLISYAENVPLSEIKSTAKNNMNAKIDTKMTSANTTAATPPEHP